MERCIEQLTFKKLHPNKRLIIPTTATDSIKMYRLGGDLNSVVCWRVTSPEEFTIDEQLFAIYILHFVSAVSP